MKEKAGLEKRGKGSPAYRRTAQSTKEKAGLKVGDEFLPEKSLEYLKNEKSKIKKKKPALRLLACIKRKEGMSLRGISRHLDLPVSTLSNWLNDIHENGIECLYDRDKSGRPAKLDKKMLAKLDAVLGGSPTECGFVSTVWTTRMMADYIHRTFGKEYTLSGLRRLLHRIDYNIIAARPVHFKSSTEEQRDDFERKLEEFIKSLPEYVVLYFDEASHPLATRQTRIWAKKGSRPTATINFMGGRVHSFGLLGDGKLYHEIYDELNTDNVVKFLSGIIEKLGKILLILDNASFHKSKKFKKFAEEQGDNLILVYLPPYTPQLNYIEMYWRMLKHQSANIYCENKEDLTAQLKRIVASGEVAIPKTK